MFLKRLLPMQRSFITKGFWVVLFLVIFILTVATPIALVQAQAVPVQPANFDLENATFGLGQTDLKTIIARTVQILLGFLGIVLVLIIMYGGWIWMTSEGDASKIDKAKRILTNAIIGLIIILAAFSIVSFILSRFDGGGAGGPTGPTPPPGPPPWGIGGGAIASVYPAPYSTDNPINVWIAVTFKEEINPESVCSEVNADGDCSNAIMDLNGDGLGNDNIQICESDGTGVCLETGPFTVDDFALSTVTNTADKKTFVIQPAKFLGFEDLTERIFTVTLAEGIERSSDGQSVFAGSVTTNYSWLFYTNGELDLDPPEIESAGVYPGVDSQADIYSDGAPPTPTTFTISGITGVTEERPATYTQPEVVVPGSPAASLSGTYQGSFDGDVTVTIASSNQEVIVDWAGTSEPYPYSPGNTILNIGPYGLTFTLSGQPTQGNSWEFEVSPYVAGDKFSLKDNNNTLATYTVGLNVDASDFNSSQSLVDFIVSQHGGIFVDPTPTVDDGELNTIATGDDSDRYSFETGGLFAVNKVPGSAAQGLVEFEGRPDVPRNTIFQITFNEAISPLSGDKILVRYDKLADDFGSGSDTPNPGTPTMTELTAGTDFTVEMSNGYRTIELRGSIECGANSCGQQIYCWPVNDKITTDPTLSFNKPTLFEVLVPTNSLQDCGINPSVCSGWGSCESVAGVNRCVKDIGSVSNPQQIMLPQVDSTNIDGIIDMAANSFNGSFNTYTDGGKTYGRADDKISILLSTLAPTTNYYLNINNWLPSNPFPLVNADPGYGDNFMWRFWMSDQIDLQSPLINKIEPYGGEQITDRFQPVNITFDRIMRSATLRPGYGYGTTAKEKSERYVLLNNLTPNSFPVGYWINKYSIDEDGDNYADYTQARINHTRYDLFNRYGTLIGSGVQSITQNCFLPAGGPEGSGTLTAGGDCNYDDPSGLDTIGCVTDESMDLTDNRVKTPNPASFAGTLSCGEIDGASACGSNAGNLNDCKVSYYQPGNDSTDQAGSWVLTSDFDTAEDNGYTGCCFGVCIAQ